MLCWGPLALPFGYKEQRGCSTDHQAGSAKLTVGAWPSASYVRKYKFQQITSTSVLQVRMDRGPCLALPTKAPGVVCMVLA